MTRAPLCTAWDFFLSLPVEERWERLASRKRRFPSFLLVKDGAERGDGKDGRASRYETRFGPQAWLPSC